MSYTIESPTLRGAYPQVLLVGKFHEDFKLEKGPTHKAKEPDPGGSDQQNLGFKKLKNRKTDRTVGLNFCITNISSGTA